MEKHARQLSGEIATLVILQAHIKNAGIINVEDYPEESDQFRMELAFINNSLVKKMGNMTDELIAAKRTTINSINKATDGPL